MTITGCTCGIIEKLKRAAGWGIPELMPPDGGRIFRVNLHAPSRQGAPPSAEKLAGAWGIPEFMPPDGGGTFRVKSKEEGEGL